MSRRLLDAAVETGRPSLTSLVLEGCPLLGAKALRGLTPSPLRPPQGEGGDGSSSQQAENADAAGEGGRGGGALLPAPPAFPHMLRLDLSCSGGGCGLLHLQLDALQAAMPALQVLKLSGLGGFHGEAQADALHELRASMLLQPYWLRARCLLRLCEC